ncbi:TonB-dependent siderophore receptor [Achromobacter piechaudii]|uniref:Ferripyoverdine receptor n=1 Tax=Achromobacter piechaudii TaxID=72556 RepID=A0A6S7C2W6_9BURK|nr:TonB-dependent receptor [Achromobacter piechaudii]CAB3828966.1 Ferripyoverdine receptor [Achromobacter piechaudii]
MSRFCIRPAHLAVSLALLFGAASAQAQPTATVEISIPAQPLAQALDALARQAKLELMVQPTLIADKNAPALHGRYTATAAFERLLAGSGLIAEFDGGSVTIRPVPRGDVTLDPVLVTGLTPFSATTEGTESYTSPVTTIGKGTQSLRDIPQAISVVTRERMDEQGMTSIYDALANTTGITLQQSPQLGKYVYSRGFRNTWYQYDGVPLERGMYGRASNYTGGTAIYDRVEVLRGASGLLQGGGEPSGAVNFVRKRALAEPGFSVTATAGMWDRVGTQLDGGGALNEAGTLRGRAVMDVEKAGSFIDHVKNTNQTYYGTLEYDLTPQTQVSLGLSYEIADGTPNVRGIPSYSDGKKLDVVRSFSMEPGWNRRHSTTQTTYFDLTHRFNDNWQAKVTAVNMRERLNMKFASSVAELDPVNNFGSLSAESTRNDIKIGGIDANLIGKIDAFGLQHELVVGANYARNKISTDYGSNSGYYVGDIFNIGQLREPSQQELDDAYLEHRDGKSEQYGVYTAARMQLAQPLKLVLGGRMSWYDIVWDTHTTGSYTDDSIYKQRVSAEFTPYAGLIFDLSREWSLYASYADIFKPQSERDKGGNQLKPVLGSNYEIGLKGELLDGRVNTTIALFRIDQKNRAQTDYSSDPECDMGWYCYMAAGKVRSQGLDAEISGEILTGWNLFAGYTYNTTKYLQDESSQGQPLNRFTPKHMLRLWSTYRLAGEWNRYTLGGGVNAESGSYDTGSVRIDNPGRAVWSAFARYRIDKNWAASVNVNNIFDKRYFTNVGTNNGGFYGDPRNVMLTLRGTF